MTFIGPIPVPVTKLGFLLFAIDFYLHFLERLSVLVVVVPTKQQLPIRKNNPYLCGSAATITAVGLG